MSKRVVVLTDGQIWECIEAIEANYEVNGDSDRRQEVVENYSAGKLLTMLRAALGHPEAITDDRIERHACEIHAAICGCAAAPDDWCDSIWLVASERGLRAALFPGEDEQ